MTSTDAADRSLTRQPAVPWETLTDPEHGARDVRFGPLGVPFDEHYAPFGALQGDCLACGKPVRWSTAYDQPHWVHVTTGDALACPMYEDIA